MASWNGVPLNSASLGIVSPREVGRKERAFQGFREIRRVKDGIKTAQTRGKFRETPAARQYIVKFPPYGLHHARNMRIATSASCPASSPGSSFSLSASPSSRLGAKDAPGESALVPAFEPMFEKDAPARLCQASP